MSNQTPQTLKGFRDFLPEEKRKRDWVQSKVVEVFKLHGFEPLETPTLEYAELLTGKYGDEADKLLYTFEDRGGRKVGLRYDQTVPTARVLGQYQNNLPKYFRRYQIQNVFRADKPQKGRYREFTQCDIDIFGSTSPLSDAEILATTYFAYKNIGFENIQIKINDRKILFEVIERSGVEKNKALSVIQSLDKLDKKSIEYVQTELEKKGVTIAQFQEINNQLRNISTNDNLERIIESTKELGVTQETLQFTPYLSRGLDYYTGLIFEVTVDGYEVGSVGGGGRYDNLINDLTGQNIPAVGMAFGFDRTVEAADQLGLIPSSTTSSQVLVTIFEETQNNSLQTSSLLRQAGITTELYPAIDNIGKQFKLANQKQIPFVIIIGQDEANQNQVALKNMITGDQQTLTLEDAITTIKSS